MRTALSSLLVLLVWGCDVAAPVAPGTPALTPEEEAAYAADAAVLAFRQTVADGDTTSVELPADLVADLADALVRVRTSEDGARILGIHALPRRSPTRLLVGAVPGSGVAEAWRAGSAETGHPTVDALVESYGLTLDRYLESIDLGVLVSPCPLNTVALAAQFGGSADVRYAEPDGLAGDGDDVEAVRTDGGWVLDFSSGSGDCPAGCIERTYWTFRVDGDGVQYLGSRER